MVTNSDSRSATRLFAAAPTRTPLRFSGRLQRGGTGKGKSLLGPVLTSADRGFSKIPAYGFGIEDDPPYRPSRRIRLIRLVRLDATVFFPLVVVLVLLAGLFSLGQSLNLFR